MDKKLQKSRPKTARLPAVKLLTGAGLLASLVLLALHATEYAFLTDDAYISFRYARNLSEGHGLVFNPGFERVEGYTNFLWVLILAAFNSLGAAPHVCAHYLTLALTAVLWLLVVWFAARSQAPSDRAWLVIAPALFLASTRSFAVWSTSGLETRLFEVLIIGGVFRMMVEFESHREEGHTRAPLAAVLFALATLTRPDGLLISAGVFMVGAIHVLKSRSAEFKRFAAGMGVYALIVGGHFAFRLSYYGEWLPNTFYAKVGDTLRWRLGFTYLAAFALEYAAYLWIPMLAAAVHLHAKRRSLVVPLLFAAIVVPHAVYVAAIGGDHFEYRPLDLYFPFAFLLVLDGARNVARRTGGAVAAGVYLLVVFGGLILLPYQSHRQFPDRYLAGFPGRARGDAAAETFMRPANDPIFGLPFLRSVGEAYREVLHATTSRFAGVRQEELRLFVAKVVPDGLHLRRLIDDGLVPPDVHIAIGSVGVIPYYSDVRTLDRIGLTDKQVARSGVDAQDQLVGHGKAATMEYARANGVDFWSLGVHVCWHDQDPKFASVLPGADGVADVGDGFYLLGKFPQGFDAAQTRFPNLILERPSPKLAYEIGESLRERGLFSASARLLRSAVEGALQLHPPGDAFRGIARSAYGGCLLDLGRYAEAERELRAGYSELNAAFGSEPESTKPTLSNLVRLYEEWGKPLKAKEYSRLVDDER